MRIAEKEKSTRCGSRGRHMENCPATPPEPAVSGEGYLNDLGGGSVFCSICKEVFRKSDNHLHAKIVRPVDSGSVDRAREFIANFPNDNYDIDEYFVIAAAAFAEQETTVQERAAQRAIRLINNSGCGHVECINALSELMRSLPLEKQPDLGD